MTFNDFLQRHGEYGESPSGQVRAALEALRAKLLLALDPPLVSIAIKNLEQIHNLLDLQESQKGLERFPRGPAPARIPGTARSAPRFGHKRK